MAQKTFTINLGSGKAGLTDLRAQLKNPNGSNNGSAISAGFVEIGSGIYNFNYDLDPAFQGSIAFYSNAAPSSLFCAIAVEATSVAVGASTDPNFVSVYTYTKRNGVIVAGATFLYQQLDDTNGESFDPSLQTAVSDGLGLVSLTWPRGSVYRYGGPSGRPKSVTIDNNTPNPLHLDPIEL